MWDIKAFEMPNTIQPGEHSMGGGTGDIPYANRDANGNRYVRYLYFSDGAWRSNYNWLENDWNDNNPAALRATRFISLLAFLRESFVL